MKSKREIVISFGIYGLGLLAMILADLYVSVNFSQEDVAEWAFIKSSILILGTLCLLGYDQVFVRDPTLIKRVLSKFLTQSVIISLIACCLIFFIKGISFIETALLFASIFLFSLLSYFSAASRANFNLWKSQFSTNFWKFFLLLCIFLIPISSVFLFFFISLAVSVLISLFLKGYIVESGQQRAEDLDEKTARSIGLAFVVHNITLILAIYGEQFLINLSNDVVTSEHLFKYFAVFTPIALSINGFLGFYLGPKVRADNNMTISRYIKFSRNIFFITIPTTVCSIIIGFLFMIYYSKIPLHDLDVLIIVSLSLMCVVRGFYTSTSVCLGVFGTSGLLKKSAKLTFAITVGYIISIFIILHTYSGIVAAQFISYSSLLNWTVRLIVSNYFTVKSLKLKFDVN